MLENDHKGAVVALRAYLHCHPLMHWQMLYWPVLYLLAVEVFEKESSWKRGELLSKRPIWEELVANNFFYLFPFQIHLNRRLGSNPASFEINNKTFLNVRGIRIKTFGKETR